MADVRYIVRARDNAGHHYVNAFAHPPPAASEQVDQYCYNGKKSHYSQVVRAEPFCCVFCGRAATQIYHVNIVSFEQPEPVLFDTPSPYCGSDICHDLAGKKSQMHVQSLGHGTLFGRFAGPDGRPQRMYRDLKHLSPAQLKACVVCGDSFELHRCAKCKIVTYCSKFCQQRHWKHHKAACKATAASDS